MLPCDAVKVKFAHAIEVFPADWLSDLKQLLTATLSERVKLMVTEVVVKLELFAGAKKAITGFSVSGRTLIVLFSVALLLLNVSLAHA